MPDGVVESLPPEVLRQLDAPCDAFELAWRRGERPDLERCLGAVSDTLRPLLLAELIRIEMEWRCRRNEALSAEEYARRFPACADDTASWLAEARGSTGELGSLAPETDIGVPSAPTTGVVGAGLPCVLGEYDLLERLGGGGMGDVFLARHRRLGGRAALKVLNARRSSSPEAVVRFLREMAAVGQVDHPNVVEALYAGEEAGVVFLVMKLVEGVDLQRLVQERGPRPPAEACELARQTARGLAYLHDHGLVHRDVKPSNLIRAVDGTVKVLDLGLARIRSEVCGQGAMTEPGMIMGTADYLAPEQAGSAGDVDGRADLYALGGTLFFLLAGRAPFAHHANVLNKVFAHVNEAPPDLRVFRPDTPAPLADLVARLLAKRPDDRPSTAAEVEQALAAFAGGEPGPGPVPAPPRRRHRWLPAACAAGCLALGLLALVVSRMGKRDRPPPPPDEPGAALRLRPLRVTHYATGGKEVVVRGVVGEQSFSTRFDDAVTLTASLSEAGYLYLVGYNFDGKEQLLWPLDEKGKPAEGKPPAPVNRLHYPPGDIRLHLDDDERGGLQAYVAVASRRPLPAWRDWRKERRNVAWRALPAGETVWQADARASYPVLRGLGADRGTPKEALGVPPLAALCRALLEGGAEAVEAVAFPVQAKEGGR